MLSPADENTSFKNQNALNGGFGFLKDHYKFEE
jgi:hypothetical protein